MKLRDRFRRWWSPARWNDDHPLEAAERSQRRGHHRHAVVGESEARVKNVERDFKKPR
jgi:hypothetical protein